MNYLELARYTTAEVADALDSCGIEGCLLNIKPLTADCKLLGPAYTVKYEPYPEKPESFQGAADYIDQVPAGAVVVIDNGGKMDCTTWGEILTRVAMKQKIQGTLVYGAVRDAAFIKEQNYPLFCCGTFMRSGKNRVRMVKKQCPIMIQQVVIHPEDLLFGDENGVLVIPHAQLAEVMSKVLSIRNTEHQIIAAVESGMSLAEARKIFHYEKPWEV
jgi:regulator of RNase E activity RraA